MAKKHKYNRNEFINILCKKCNLCKNTENPTFCYDFVYKQCKRKFIQKIFPKLLTLKTKEKSSGALLCTYNPKVFESIFRQTFCDAKICKEGVKNCNSFFKCTTMFRLQLHGIKPAITSPFSNYKTKKENENRYIAKPYPTFFTNTKYENNSIE